MKITSNVPKTVDPPLRFLRFNLLQLLPSLFYPTLSLAYNGLTITRIGLRIPKTNATQQQQQQIRIFLTLQMWHIQLRKVPALPFI